MTSPCGSLDGSESQPLPGGQKRKRASTGTSTGLDVAGRVQLDQKVTRGRKTSTKPNANLQKEPSKGVECLVPWPATFQSLEKVHKALNLVFTFCCTRKHLATTFDTIKSAVEAHIHRALTIEEVASVVALRPEGINFAYVDELMLELEVKGSERDDTFKSSKSARSQAPAHDQSVGGFTGKDSLEAQRDGDATKSTREILFFEFVDGDLKRQVLDKKTGEPTRPNRKLREEELKMPVYSQKQMTQLIERRNQRFATAINIFLNKCTEDGVDPDSALSELSQAYIPIMTANLEDSNDTAPSNIPENIPKERKSIPEIVQELKDSSWYAGQIVPDGHRVFEPQPPVYGDLEFLLSQNLVNALYNTKGITRFYAHQTEALNSLHNGQNVVVATSTSSGKSLIYQLPVLHALEKDYNSRAMYIFPTKALAQDQKRSLKEMMAYMPGMEETIVETFDGDTPMNERNAIREQARIIFTNPDMLHVTILPQEERWRTFIRNLKYVVGKWEGTYVQSDFDIFFKWTSCTTTTDKWVLIWRL
jgi:DEAD/DEAH box helicase domain-containing protein